MMKNFMTNAVILIGSVAVFLPCVVALVPNNVVISSIGGESGTIKRQSNSFQSSSWVNTSPTIRLQSASKDDEEEQPRQQQQELPLGGPQVPPPPREDPFGASAFEKPLIRPLRGGTAMIFEMARKCMVDWSTDDYSGAAVPSATATGIATDTTTTASSPKSSQQQPLQRRKRSKVLPRWHPHSGISDINPSFRTEAPVMNNKGFAKSIWRNVRKRNKPSLWRQALRIYDRMAELEEDRKLANTALTIQRSNIHHEGAMLACAKLGLWQRALEIYYHVLEVQQRQQEESEQGQQGFQEPPEPLQSTTNDKGQPPASSPLSPPPPRGSIAATAAARAAARLNRRVYVTDNMILSLIRACVRASRKKSSSLTSPVPISPTIANEEQGNLQQQYEEQEQQEHEEAMLRRRIPLDTAMEILNSMEETHNIPVVARHVNSISGAYQSLGFLQEARNVIQTHLTNRTSGEESEDGTDFLNVFDFCAKDKGSYSLLVQSAVASGDWASAIEALKDMTEAGLYPTSRHCNAWTGISERQSQRRMAGSWKKKRDDYWLESVR